MRIWGESNPSNPNLTDHFCALTMGNHISRHTHIHRVINSKRTDSVNGNKLTDVLTKLLAADFQRKTRLDPFENKRSKAKMWNATEVSKNVLSTLNSAKVTVAAVVVIFLPVMSSF